MYLEKLVENLKDVVIVDNAIKKLQEEAEMLLKQKTILDSKIEVLVELSGKTEVELQKEINAYIKEKADEEINTSVADNIVKLPVDTELCDSTEIDTEGDSTAGDIYPNHNV